MVQMARLLLPCVLLHWLTELSRASANEEDPSCLLQRPTAVEATRSSANRAVAQSSSDQDGALPSIYRSRRERQAASRQPIAQVQIAASKASVQLNDTRQPRDDIVREGDRKIDNRNTPSGYVYEMDDEDKHGVHFTKRLDALPLHGKYYVYDQQDSNHNSLKAGKKWCDYIVDGAGVLSTNGCYLLNGTFKGKPKYSQVSGNAIIYWSVGWKINYRDDTTGWYYFASSVESVPPNGTWSTEGYPNGNADPPPRVFKQDRHHHGHALLGLLELFLISVALVTLCVCCVSVDMRGILKIRALLAEV